MLLKTSNSNSDKAFNQSSNGKGKSRSLNSRIHRKTLKIAAKPSSSVGKRAPAGKRISLGKNQKNFHASKNFPTTSSTLCDNSNDSGLGFDHHESHHSYVQQHPNMPQQQVLALTNNYHRTMNTATRYGVNEIMPSSHANNLTTSASSTIQKHGLYVGMGIGKKIKGVKVSTVAANLTLKTETEDTCGDDFFSTHFQKKNENQMNSSTLKSPTTLTNDCYASSSSEKHSVASSSSSSITSLSERSSPTTPTDEISSSAILENNDSSGETLHEGSLQNQQLSNISRDGSCQLQILTQPEQQHRARYQTEGSRGAVKDKSGNGFPVVKLNGCNKPTILQVFIGNDIGRVSPHIFYQACKVSGKNSTPCNESKVDGTMIIEIEMKPENDMTVICDCVGILKERNVDVEHRLGKNRTLAASVSRNKKKSTKCRMIFRTKVDGESEILQICSNTITCTQPPGVPEISKKSLESCSVMGGQELFIIGKNFLKDTKVTFVKYNNDQQQHSKKVWEESVLPDKEYLQQTHLICVIPPYTNADDVTEPIQVQFYITSSNKKSEPHNFVYVPLKKYRSIPHSPSIEINNAAAAAVEASTNLLSLAWNDCQTSENIIMPPPLVRKSSFSKNIITETCSSTNESSALGVSSGASISLKCEYIDQTLINTNAISNNNNNNNNNNSSEPTQSTSSSANNMQPSNPNLFNDSAMIDVTNSCFVSSSEAAIARMVGQVQVQNLLNEAASHHHIKNEQNDQQSSVLMSHPSSDTSMITQTSEALSSVQQQQVVENFINMICAQVEVPAVSNDINHHLSNDLIMNSSVVNSTCATSTLQSNDHTVNLISAISSPMICDSNLIVTNIPISMDSHESPGNSSNDTSNASLVSNAVSESVAETQAAVQNIIANVAAEMLQVQENPTETQSTINNFISTTLGASIEQQQQQQQQQISTSQQQQLQEIIAQELLTAPVMIKKEDNNGQDQNVQENMPQIVSTTTSSMTQPFSPTPDFNLTSMSENDLINFINPTVFM